ncbi:hypothetical protein ABKA04_006583 [Annulohypoxylon sp. FPYF3050]
MVRVALVALIHDKTMNSYVENISEGKVLTLANTDVDSIDTIGEMLHETWGQVLEVIIGIIMLTWEVGWFSLVPIFIIVLCSRVSRYVAKNMRLKQGIWNEATQNRISMTSSVISAIRNVKLLGLQAVMASHIEGLRFNELSKANAVRWILFAYNASANANGMFAPVLTLIFYAISAKTNGNELDVGTAFTTIAILTMVTHPANMVMTFVPKIISSYASFERIQTFLLEPSRQDCRIEISNPKAVVEPGSTGSDPEADLSPAISVEDLSIGDSHTALEDIKFNVPQGSTVFISGATAAGKSILVRSILGEIESHGTVALTSKRVGYCSQIPWLPNGSIRQIITGFPDEAPADFAWYSRVIETCCLMKDIHTFRDGDETLVGSRGANISGGQRQRLALARAIFARTDIIILDDPFSALDGTTENEVVNNLFGSDGLFKNLGTTVLSITNSSQYFYLADEIIILEMGRIKERGKWNDLSLRDPEILKVITSKDSGNRELVSGESDLLPQQQRSSDDVAADSKRKTGDTTLYSYYIKAAGLGNFALMVACTVIYSFFITFPQYWVKMWTSSRSRDEWFFIGGYIAINLIAYVATNGIAWTIHFRMAPQSGLILHQKLLHTITCAPLLYFSLTDNGSILNRWLKIILDLLVAAIAIGVIALAVVLRNTTSGGSVGMALNIVLIANTTLLRLIQTWTNLEISLGAIARIKGLEDEVSPEDQPSETSVPPETWPSSGAIEFRSVTAAYNAEDTVLEDVSLRVNPGQKVIICGRTGSGKSSMLLTLHRLLDTTSGLITVDGVNISLVPRSVIRKRCFVTVPQEPLLFNHESLRFNVDPTGTLSNGTIIEELSKVYLWQHFGSAINQENLGNANTSTHPILDRELTSLPPLSVGQRQLLALARALLQVYVISTSGAKPIVLLDEATSSLDPSTEKVILDIINQELTEKGHTVIMVAHRVGAAISHLRPGVDAVVWMKDGQIEKIGDVSDVMNIAGQTITPEEEL